GESWTPWAWTFNCPNGTGYYEFYSIGANYSIDEVTPGSADASCHVNYSDWNRFGYYPVGQKSDNLTNVLQGSNFTCPSNSIANNMTVWIESWDPSTDISCAIYRVDNGTLVNYTEQKTIGIYQGWVTFNFTGEPSLVAGTKYYLVAWGDGGHTRYNIDASYHIRGANETSYAYPSFPNNISTIPGIKTWDNHVLSIYCRYTESGPLKPVNSNPYPANKSTNIPLTPAVLYINVNDAGGHLMNITFRTNESGTWWNADTNSSVGNGTYYCLNTSWIDSYSTKYWWSVNTNDGDGGWDNDTYYFTTRASYKPDAPGSFTALANNRTKITLTWTDDTVVDSTRIEWNSGEDSTWNVGDHTLLYNGSAETTTHIGLDPSQTVYYKAWSYNVTDKLWSNGVTTNETTDSNSVPTASLINPSPNGTTEVSILPILNVSVSDSNSDNVSVTFYDKSHNSIIGTDTVIGGSGYATATWSGLGYNKEYKWYVKVDDSYNNSIEPDGPGSYWNFTTGANLPPYSPVLVSPANGSTGLSRNPTLRVNVTDPNGGTLKVSFYKSGGILLSTVTNVASGSSASYVWSGLSYLTNYSWYVV
ncbi:MAG: hypothetical protein MUO82_03320, partial [Candidatus Thermoplasmatota archaeon]|nr:hypothetical protein [Candidatus Thermoplasmatota archaeon]